MKKIYTLFALVSILVLSCSETKKTEKETEESCENTTIKDPNEVKPMARMMRTMANYCDTMRLKINKNELVDSIAFPLMPFWTAEPTDSSVLETLFFNNAKMFENAYRKLMQDQAHQKENYTALIGTCVHCHSSYCSGPLKRIKKLPLDYKE
jgi:PBP1b-binding outer membrane lipoprotein LpoB